MLVTFYISERKYIDYLMSGCGIVRVFGKNIQKQQRCVQNVIYGSLTQSCKCSVGGGQ